MKVKFKSLEKKVEMLGGDDFFFFKGRSEAESRRHILRILIRMSSPQEDLMNL